MISKRIEQILEGPSLGIVAPIKIVLEESKVIVVIGPRMNINKLSHIEEFKIIAATTKESELSDKGLIISENIAETQKLIKQIIKDKRVRIVKITSINLLGLISSLSKELE